MRKSWLIVCLCNFLVASLMGLTLRLSQVIPIDIEYAHLLHAHSHTAMLGWAYLVIFSLIVHRFVPAERQRKYDTLFWVTQISVLGMMASFPVQGYAPFSIAFSTMHILCSYVFCFRILKDMQEGKIQANVMLRIALVFMVLSTMGAWSLGVLGATLGRESAWYKLAIQFFLHFQFNGWFVGAVLALILSILKGAGEQKIFKLFCAMFVGSVVLTLGLPISWNFSGRLFIHLNWVGGLVQFFALVLFLRLIRKQSASLSANATIVTKSIIWLSLMSFALKIVLQFATIIPEIADSSHKIRNFAVGFIHLAMLGAVTGLIIFLLSQAKISLLRSQTWSVGVFIFSAGFLLTEVILFIQGLFNMMRVAPMQHYAEIMFGTSVLLPVGIAAMLFAVIKSADSRV